MPQKVASPKQTGGGGFVFEDKAVGYFLACLLNHVPPIEPKFGTIARVDFQTRADGWYLDDVLLTLEFGDKRRQCAFSIKSNRQFTSNGARPDFVSTAWEQFLNENSTPFNPDSDLLGILTSPPSQNVLEELSELLSWARQQSSDDLERRITQPGFGTKIKRKLFESFACPSETAEKYGLTKQDIGKLLRVIVVSSFDLQQEASQRIREAIQYCRSSLISGSLEEGLKLWEKLQGIARSTRSTAGYLDREKLLAELRTEFDLKDLLPHESDWKRLRSYSEKNLEGIQSRIGNSVHLTRDLERAALEEALQESKAVLVLGPSGCGKTVLLKSWAEKQLTSTKLVWVNANILDTSENYSWETKLKLSHSIQELLAESPNRRSFCVIDGLDRVMTHFQNLKCLVSALRLDSSQSPWSLVTTCQPEEWNRIQTELVRNDIAIRQWKTVPVSELTLEDLEPVWDAFPTLRHLRIHSRLHSLLLKPKILDLFAVKISLGGHVDAEQWIGESDLIEWFWQMEVAKGNQGSMRGSFVKQLGEKLGDEVLTEVPTDSFSISDQAPLQGLIQDRICIQREEHVSFQHDLYGDWARQRVLLGKKQNIQAYLSERLVSPLWHRATRLFALHLIERSQDLTFWRSSLQVLSGEKGAATIGQDLFLEAAIFGASPRSLLEKLWADLKANNGLFLKRLLGRFLHVATFPNPLIQAMARSLGTLQAESASFRRLPYWPYWPAMIQTLHGHMHEAASLAPKYVAEVADLWLRQGSPDAHLRILAAEMALAVADNLTKGEKSHGWDMSLGQLGESICRAVLASYSELSEKVRAYVLCASGRIPASTSSSEEAHQAPWPDGPVAMVDHEFQRLILDTDALQPLIEWDPALAREIILALLIERPLDHHYGYDHGSRGNLCIEDRSEWFPPLYFRGPFLSLLRINRAEGLELIMRLVKFATDRWEELSAGDDSAAPHVVIKFPFGDRKWIGDGRVYFWYRNNGFCPHPVSVALMALEKWFYEELDKNSSIEGTVETILRESNSLAFAGLLTGVAGRESSLSRGALKPFLEVPEFLLWEAQYNAVPHHELLIGWTQPQFLKLAQEWHSLPHRQLGFHIWSKHLFLNDHGLRPVFECAKAKWKERIEKGDGLKDFLEKIVAEYTIENYKLEKQADGRAAWSFVPPTTLRERSDKILNDNQARQLVLLFPFQCSQILQAQNPIPEQEIDSFWESVRKISAMVHSEDGESILEHVNALCGGATVLLTLNAEWLNQDPSRVTWCTEQLLKTIEEPPKPGTFDSEIMRVDSYWEGFAAQAIPRLWVENISSARIRNCVAKLVTTHHYGTVRNLFACASTYRKQLGSDFSRLQLLLLRWASARIKSYRTRSTHKFKKKVSFDLEAWLEKERADFVAGTTPSEIPPWSKLEYKEEIADLATLRLSGNVEQNRVNRKTLGFDLGLVQAAYEWTPALAEVDQEERKAWIEFWRTTFSTLVIQLSDHSSQDYEIEGTPSNWDIWVLRRISQLLFELKADERPQLFWQEILDLGAPAHYWVSDFLREWLNIGLRLKPTPANFVKRWQEMLTYAFSSPQWNFKSGWRWYRLEELWCNLMGLSGVSDCWTEDCKDIVAMMSKDLEHWADIHKDRLRCCHSLIAFLALPAAQPILFKGLVWIEHSCHRAGDKFWTEHGIQDSLSHLLSYVTQSHEACLRQDNEAFISFNRLMRELANRQDPVGLELHDYFSRNRN